jgi:hypothetical protein
MIHFPRPTGYPWDATEPYWAAITCGNGCKWAKYDTAKGYSCSAPWTWSEDGPCPDHYRAYRMEEKRKQQEEAHRGEQMEMF